jgi:hypothetical protein
VTSEALFHLLGGRAAGWKPMNVRHEGDSHWFLKHDNGTILDATAAQFTQPPPYADATGRGFLTHQPSKRARALIHTLLWQED